MVGPTRLLIVVAGGTNVMGAGFVDSLAKPGGKTTASVGTSA